MNSFNTTAVCIPSKHYMVDLSNQIDLKAAIRRILMEGTKLTYNAQQDEIVQMQMYGLIRNDHNTVRVANRIFEMMLYNLFLSDEELRSMKSASKE